VKLHKRLLPTLVFIALVILLIFGIERFNKFIGVSVKKIVQQQLSQDVEFKAQEIPSLPDFIDADSLQGKEASFFAPLADLQGLTLEASSISPGTFSGTTDYTFPGNLKIKGGQIYLTPISEGVKQEGVFYYNKDTKKAYIRNDSGWVDLTQQNTDTNKVGVTLVVAASNSKDTLRADYVADGTNDEEQIQSAIDNLPSIGGKIQLLEGTYYISAAVNLKISNLEIAGAGSSTRLILQSATNFFKWDSNSYDQNSDGRVDPGGTALTDIFIHDMELDGNKSSLSTPSDANADAGVTAAIKIFNSSRITISDMYIHDMVASYAVLLKGTDNDLSIDTAASDALIHNNIIRSIGSSDQNNGAVYSDLDNTIISNNLVDTVSGNGINIDDANEGFIVDNIVQAVTASTGDEGYAIVTGYGATEITIADNTIVGASRGIANHIGGSEVGDNHVVTGNTLRDSSDARDYAIKLQDDGHVVTGNRITNWGQVGIYLDAVQNTVIDGNVIDSSNEGNTSGIEVKAGSHNLVISNNMVWDMGTTASKGHGITVSTATAVNNILITGNRAFDSGAGVQDDGMLLYATPDTSQIQIEGNYLEDNVSNAIKVDGGAALSSTLKAQRNRGFATEASGTATISSGSTSVAVSHGLAITPTAADIQVTPTNNLGSATKFWITSAGATTFTINVDVDPGASTATFAWSAQDY